MGGASGVCASFEAAEYGGVKYSAWCEAPPKIGGCSRCARPAGTLAAEKYVLAGGAGQNMILSFSAGCGRRNSARRALPGEGRWTERWVRAFGFFAGCRPDLLALPGESVGRLGAWEPMGFCGLLPGSAAFPGQAMGRKGGWIPLRRRPKLEDSRTNTQGNERERAGALSLLPGNGGSKASLCLGPGGRGPCPCQGAITAQMPALLVGFS